MRTEIALVGSFLLAATLQAQGSQMGNDSAAMARGKNAMGAMDHESGSMGKQWGFTGIGGRNAAGGFEIVTADGRQVLRLSKDFSVDEISDAAVVLSQSGAVDGKSLTLGRLSHARGAASFEIPAGTDLAAYHRVVIWSKRLGTALAAAPLGSSGGGMARDNMGH
jgi:electron transfer DM13